jgi:hypothetical protein
LLIFGKLVARIEEISYLSQSINKTRWEKLNTHLLYNKKTQEIRERSVEQTQSIGEEPRSRSRPKYSPYSCTDSVRTNRTVYVQLFRQADS